MRRPTKNKILMVSILISLMSIGVTIFINIDISKEYVRVDGKTRALFGIKELYQYGYQYYVAGLGITSLIFLIFSRGGNFQPYKMKIAIILSILSLIIVFARIWRLFI